MNFNLIIKKILCKRQVNFMKKLFFALILFFVAGAVNFANAANVTKDSYNNYIEKDFYDNDENLVYPIVTTLNPTATVKINKEIRKDIQMFLDDIKKRAGNDEVKISISYEIPCNHNGGILSIILREYVFIERAAHPWNIVHTLNFNTDSGERLTVEGLSEIAKHGNDYTPEEITRRLKVYSKINHRPLYSDFQQLDKVPEDFYFDDNLHVHFLFQQQTIAHYAVGIIDLDADAYADIVDTAAN